MPLFWQTSINFPKSSAIKIESLRSTREIGGSVGAAADEPPHRVVEPNGERSSVAWLVRVLVVFRRPRLVLQADRFLLGRTLLADLTSLELRRHGVDAPRLGHDFVDDLVRAVGQRLRALPDREDHFHEATARGFEGLALFTGLRPLLHAADALMMRGGTTLQPGDGICLGAVPARDAADVVLRVVARGDVDEVQERAPGSVCLTPPRDGNGRERVSYF